MNTKELRSNAKSIEAFLIFTYLLILLSVYDTTCASSNIPVQYPLNIYSIDSIGFNITLNEMGFWTVYSRDTTGITQSYPYKINTTHPEISPVLTAEKNHYSKDETPSFDLEYILESDLPEKSTGTGISSLKEKMKSVGTLTTKDTTIKARLYHNNKLTDIEPDLEEQRTGKISLTIPKMRSFQAGIYRLEVELTKDTKTYTQEQDFTWGLVSLNSRKSIYRPGETAELIIVVLDKDGHSVCNAGIRLNITSPDNKKTFYSTAEGTVTAESECGLYNAKYQAETEGNHTIDITALIDGIDVSFSTYFLVQEDYEFDIIRTAESKIDPTKKDSFDVKIDIESFAGADSITVTVREFVPAEFDVISDANIKAEGDTKILTWSKDLTGNKTSASYSYSVPHVWPYLYALGPAEIRYGSQAFTEARPWYVAVDPAQSNASLILFWDGATIPSGWTCISCSAGDPFYEKFPRGNSTYGNQSGNNTHNHTVSWNASTGPNATTTFYTGGSSPVDLPTSTHTHNTLNSGSTSGESLLPKYRSLKVIRYNSGIPSTIPAGAIAIFNATPPAGWAAYSLQDTYFAMGNGTVAAGGSNTHTHSASITTGVPSANASFRSGSTTASTAAHTHTGSGTTASADQRPPYIEVIFANASADTGIPEGMIAMFNSSELSPSLTVMSNSGGAFYGKFIVGNSTNYGNTGGNSNHTHTNLLIKTGGPTTGALRGTSGSATNTAPTTTHTHNITVSFSTKDNLPPYTDVVFAYARIGKLNVTTNKTGYNSSETVNASGTFYYSNGAPISGENVTVEFINTSNAVVQSGNATTDSSGKYSKTWNIPFFSASGTYRVNVTASTEINTAANTTTFLVYGATYGSATHSPATHTSSSITQTQGDQFNLTVTFQNQGPDTAKSLNISLVNSTGITLNSTFEQCGNVASGADCIKSFKVTVAVATVPGTYWVNSTTNWVNNNTIANSTNATTEITVESNPVLEIPETQITNTVNHSRSKLAGNFTVNSTGNDALNSINFYAVGGSLPQSWLSFSPSAISSLAAGSTQNVNVTVTVPAGQAPALYWTNLTVNSTEGKKDWLWLNITVPADDSWTRTPAGCQKGIGINQTGTLCIVTVNNTGNVLERFNVTPDTMTNYTEPDETTFDINPWSISTFNILYNSTDADVGNYTVAYNVSGNGTPSYLLIDVNLAIYNYMLTINLISPTQSSPQENRTSGETLEIRTEAFFNNGTNEWEEKTNMTWDTVYINVTKCTIANSAFDSAADNWQVNCTLPDITDAMWYDLTLEGKKTPENIRSQGKETNAIHYKDVTPPSIFDISVSPTLLEIHQNVTIAANVTDNVGIDAVWAEITGTVTVNRIMAILTGNRYYVNYTPPANGTYNVRIYANDTPIGNLANTSIYQFAVYNATTGYMDQTQAVNVPDITWTNSGSFVITLTFYNTGNTTAYSTNITIEKPAGWTANSTFEQCGNVAKEAGCIKSFNITVLTATASNTFYINGTAEWRNPDDTSGSAANQTTVNVLSNPILDVPEASITGTVNHSTEKTVGSFAVNSTGNDALTTVQFDCVSGNMSSSWIEYIPSSVSSLAAGTTQSVDVNVTVPAGQAPGDYYCKINVTSSNDGSDWLWLNITIPLDDSWTRTPATCAKAVQANTTGTACSVTVQNTGNVQLNFSITPTTLTNYTKPSTTSFTIAAQGSDSFNIDYNTTGAKIGYVNVTTYNISSNSSSITYQTTKVTITVVTVPWWNSYWKYRKPIYLNETRGIQRVDWPVEINVSVNSHVSNCTKEIRVISIETGESVEITSQVISGNDLTWCNFVFLANISANAVNEQNYFVYYGNPDASAPTYTDPMTNTITSTNWDFNNSKISWHYDLDGTYGAGTGSAMAWIKTPGGTTMNTDSAYAGDDWETLADSSGTVTTLINGPVYKKIQLTDGASRTEHFHIYAKQNWFKVNYTVAPNGDTYELNLASLDDAGTSSQDAYYDGTGPVTSGTAYTATRYFWSEYNTGAQGFGIVVGPANQPFETNTLTFYDSTTGYEWYSNDLTTQSFFAGYPFWFFTNDDGTTGANTTANKIKNPLNVSSESEEKLILPNITTIAIYDVTGLGSTHTGGTLVKSSQNTTFDLFEDYDIHSRGIYRVEINVTGNASWTISPLTIAYHENLSSSWLVGTANDIWYTNGTQTFTGGTFSSGKVTWSTSGGYVAEDKIVTFAYVMNLTGYTQARQVHFFINETDHSHANGLSWDGDYSTYNVTQIGYLEAALILPPDNTIVPWQRNFTINGTVYCRSGDCWNVYAYARYNASSLFPDTTISASAGATPFYINDGKANPQSCGSMLINGYCNISWVINTTGIKGAFYEIGILFNTTLNQTNHTSNSTIEIDATPPQLSGSKTSPASGTAYSSGASYQFNITWTDNLEMDTVLIEHNFTGPSTPHNESYTGSNGTGKSIEYYFNFQDLAAGTYVWKYYANDTGNNLNSTDQWTYTVTKADHTLHLALNSTENDLELIYPDTTNATGWTEITEGASSAKLYRNSTEVSAGSPAAEIAQLAAGYWNYTYYYPASGNYTAQAITRFITINKGASSTSVTFSPSDSETYPTETTATCSIVNGDTGSNVQLLRNGTIVSEGSAPQSEIITLDAGIWNYTCYYNESENYTAGINPDNFLTISKGNSNLNLLLNSTDSDFSINEGTVSNMTITLATTDTVYLYVNGTLWDSGNAPFTNISLFSNPGLYNITGIYSGNSNYLSSSETHWLNVNDTTTPQITIESPLNQTYAQTWVWANVTLDEPCSWCGVSLNSTSNQTLSNSSATDWYLSLTVPAEGSNNVKFYCNDIAGNMGTTAAVYFTTDATFPKYSDNQTNSTKFGTDVLFSLYWEDNIALADYIFSLDNGTGTFENDTFVAFTGTGNWSNVTKTINSTIGSTIRWQVFANDTSGNMNASSTYSFLATSTDDSTPPQITIQSPQNTTYKTQSIWFNITGSETLNWSAYSLDGASNITLVNSSGNWWAKNNSVTEGAHTVVFWANDSAGLMNSTEISFTVDLTYPLITIQSPKNTTYTAIIIDFNITGSEILNWSGYSLDGADIISMTNESGKWWAQNTSMADGSHTVEFFANDSAGNMNSTSIKFTINTKMPVIWFEDPTPANNSNFNMNWTYINTTISDYFSPNNLTAFINWNNSLVGWWRFNLEAGENDTLAKDWSIWENNGTITNTNPGIDNCTGNCSGWTTSGKFGYGMQFDGVDDYITMGSDASLNLSNAWTIKAWIKKNASQQGAIVSNYNSAGNNAQYHLEVGATDKLKILSDAGASGGYTGSSTLQNDMWYHVAGTYNGSAWSLYLDGVAETLSGDSETPPTSGFGNTTIGRAGDASRYFNGTIDEVRIFKRALSEEEINASYNAGVYRLYHNFTNLIDGNYTFTAYVQNSAGNTTQTETRAINLGISSFLEVNLSEPDTSTPINIVQNMLLLMNATVICRQGNCGNVAGTVLYNKTSGYPDTPLNETLGAKPFYIHEIPALSTKSCNNNPLYESAFCNLTWLLNATGAELNSWKIGVNFSSDAAGVLENTTSSATINIIPCFIDISVGWNSIDFENPLVPNTYENPALGNNNLIYNITINPGSCNTDTYIKGTNMENSTLGSMLGVGNLTWSNSSNDYATSCNMTSSYNPLMLGVPQYANITTWYWINVPPIYAAAYNGTVYIQGVKSGSAPP